MIVFKYGGTALLQEEKLLKTVLEGLKEHKKIILVVSALARYPEPYATDTLFKISLILLSSLLRIHEVYIYKMGNRIKNEKRINT